MKILTQIAALLVMAMAAQALPQAASMEDAMVQAAEQNRDILVDFTGSDWCTACVHLRSQIIGSEEFEKTYGERFVMLAVDFPRNPTAQAAIPEEERQLREQMLKGYGIEGLPAVVLMDAKGMPYEIICGTRHTPAEYIALVEAGLQKRATRDAAFAEAANQTGRAKAKTLANGLKALPRPCRKHYHAERAIIDSAKKGKKKPKNPPQQ